MGRILKACSRCGAHPSACRCPPRRAPNARWSPWRTSTEQNRFRQSLIRLYDGRCAYVVDGERCTAMSELHAHHGKNGEPDLLLCRPHHRAVDPLAR